VNFTFDATWIELYFTLIFIMSEEKRTVPLGRQYLIAGDDPLWRPIMAGAVLETLPVMVLSFVVQQFVFQGTTAGSVKG